MKDMALLNPEVQDRAAADDRRWFAANPGIHTRVRRAFKNELPGAPSWILVIEFEPGVRGRFPYDFDEGVSHE